MESSRLSPPLSISPKRASSLSCSPCTVQDDSAADDDDNAFAGIVSKRRRMNDHHSDSDSDLAVTPSPRASPLQSRFRSQDLVSSTPSPVGFFTDRLVVGGRRLKAPMSLFRELREADGDNNARSADPANSSSLLSMDRPPSMASSFCSGVDSSLNSSTQSSRVGSPYGDRKYQKHELWAAIKSDYHYLMDEEIIETCKSTESDLSWESGGDGDGNGGKFSLSEFVQQYNELSEWLNTIQNVTQRRQQGTTLSEKYLNQSYYEEMLHKSPRKKLFNEYARQLVRRYPDMRDEINVRIQRVNTQWAAVLEEISPANGYEDPTTLLKDLEQDVGDLRRWLYGVEERLPNPLIVQAEWNKPQLLAKLQQHKAVQSEIESHSQIVTAVLKLCERLDFGGDVDGKTTTKHGGERGGGGGTAETGESLTAVAQNLERRWHNTWLHSLEWQYRLEEALASTKTGFPSSGFDRDENCWEDGPLTSTPASTQTEPLSTPYGTQQHHQTTGCDPGYIESDTSCNYDVLPFSENEYEKLTDNGLTEDDDDNFDDEDLSSTADHGFDSALGRSVSDDSSIGKLSKCLKEALANQEAAAAVALREEEGKKEEQQQQAPGSSTMRAAAAIEPPMCGTKHSDSHDVGYSSESQSNEELDFSNPQQASSPKLDMRIQLKLSEEDEAEPRLRSKDRLGDESHKARWRQSMTSAYDTSSNCSDLNSPHDLDVALDTSVDTVREVGHNDTATDVSVLTTPNNSYYCMTTIESMTDTEPSSAADRHDAGAKSGATTDAECDLSRSLDGHQIEDLPYDGSFQHHITSIAEEATSGTVSVSTGDSRSDVNTTEKERAMSMSVSGGSSHDLEHAATSDPDSSPSRRQKPNQNDLSELATALKKYLAEEQKKTETLKPTLNNDNEAIVLCEEDIRNGNSTAEELPRSAKQTNNKVNNSLKVGQKISKPIAIPPKAMVHKATNDSFTSTDGSIRQTDDACDASSEGTGSESESDFSTASSDNEQDHLEESLLSGLHGSSRGNSTLCEGSQSLGSSPVKSASSFLRHHTPTKRKGDRPHSMADLYSLHMYPSCQYSISESAIDHLRSRALQEDNLKLRRTTSDSTSLVMKRHDSPRKHRRRRLRRTKSDETAKVPYSTSGRRSGRSSPVMIPSSPAQHHSTPRRPTAKHLITSDSEIETTRGNSRHNRSETVRRALDCDSCTERVTPHNSTVDSATTFSEQAWDNYQVAPYSSVSEDPNEEKLDASHLAGEWEHNLDFEEDFQHDSRFGSGFGKKSKGSNSGSGSFPASSQHVADDSDSDLEDFNDVLEESSKALHFTENTLQINRKDAMETGLFLDPSEYKAALATCRTNLACLEEVSATLQLAESVGGDNALTLTDTDGLQQVADMIADWRHLEAVARSRVQQSHAVAALYRSVGAMQQTMLDVQHLLHGAQQRNQYEDRGQLEEMLAELQRTKSLLSCEGGRLQESQETIDSLQLEHPSINMTKCEAELRGLSSNLDGLLSDTGSVSTELQSKLLAWYELSEIQRELSYLLKQERREFACLELARALAQSREEIAYSLHDIELLTAALSVYEANVSRARELYEEIADVCSARCQHEVTAALAGFQVQTAQLQEHCAQLMPVLERAHMFADVPMVGPGQVAHSVPVALGDSTVWHKLRNTLPLPVAMAIVFGAVYLLDTEGLVFSPQLRYVRGPPPT